MATTSLAVHRRRLPYIHPDAGMSMKITAVTNKNRTRGLRTDPRPERRLPPDQVVGTIISLRVPVWLEAILRKEAHNKGLRPGVYVRKLLVEMYGHKDISRCKDHRLNKQQRRQQQQTQTQTLITHPQGYLPL
jgi:hypothetical protein